jgi:Fe-S cluster biogenesis protein NfuA
MHATDISGYKQKVEQALEQIRPFLLEDGGDLELVELTNDLIAKVELKGACKSCSMSNMTFKAGVEDAIRRAVPEIKDVVSVNL